MKDEPILESRLPVNTPVPVRQDRDKKKLIVNVFNNHGNLPTEFKIWNDKDFIIHISVKIGTMVCDYSGCISLSHSLAPNQTAEITITNAQDPNYSGDFSIYLLNILENTNEMVVSQLIP